MHPKRPLEHRFGAGIQQDDSTPCLPLTRRSAASAIICAVLLLLGTATGYALNTLHVPADQPTIQAGIDAAANGDTVLVAPGTYYENIDFKGKAITVTSSAGSAATFIDGGNHSGTAVVTFQSQELRTSILSGFTIQHGGTQTATSQASGGIYVHAAAPAIINNIIAGNRCSGIFANGGALIQANIVADTLYQNTPSLPDLDPYCQQGGTGIVVEGTTPVGPYSYVEVLGNTVTDNTQALNVGGIAINAAEGTLLQSNIISSNSGSLAGGIATSNTQAVTIIQNLVVSNAATANNAGAAGGIAISSPQYGSSIPPRAVIAQNTVAGNQLQGGIPGESATELNLTGAVSQYLVANNIFVGSSAIPPVNCSVAYASLAPTPVSFDHNDVYNPDGKAYGGACSDQTGLSGNISADPLFVTPGFIFHVMQGSPTIDSGNNSAYALPPIDLEASPRIQDATHKGYPVVDMGVYEYPGVLDGGAYNTVLTSSLNPAPYGQLVTLTASVTATSVSVGNPSGTVTFADGGAVLSTQTLQTAGLLSASASFSTSVLTAGSHTITATYNPPSGSQAGSASLTQTITGLATSTAVVSSLNPSPAGQPVTFTATVNSSSASGGTPGGTLRFLDGPAVLSTQTLTATGNTSATASFTTSSLSAGVHTITAAYDGSAGLSPSSGTVSQTVLGASATTTTLSGSPNPAYLGKDVSFVVTVNSAVSAAGPPAGTVTLTLAGTTVLGTQTVTPAGSATSQATFNISSIPLGGQAIQASYNATGNFLSSTAAITETIVLPPDFSLTPGQIAVSVQTQHHTTTPLTLTSLYSFQDSVAVSCGNLPAYVTCRSTPSPASLTPGSTASVSLYIDTDSVIGYASVQHPGRPGAPLRIPPITGLAIAAPAYLAARRRFRSGAVPLRLLLLLLASCASLAGLAGCGSIILPIQLPPSATPGTYSIPITATGAVTGIIHSSVLTLTITP